MKVNHSPAFSGLAAGRPSALAKKTTYLRVLIYRGTRLSQENNNLALTATKLSYQKRSFSIEALKAQSKETATALPLAKRAKITFEAQQTAPVIINQIPYSGTIIAVAHQGKILLINEVAIEKYLLGVVKAEISTRFPSAAIKAQAIAARSYAYHLFLKNPAATYHLGSSSRFQVFKGIQNTPTNIADGVKQTEGIVLSYQEKPIQTFFHASCGGMTATAQEVWPSSEALPYFQNVRCHYCTTHSRFNWQTRYRVEELATHLKSYQLGAVKGVAVQKWSASKRAAELKIVGRKKKILLTGNAFRIVMDAVKIGSTKFTLKKQQGNYLFVGTGFGHGVGLCQWGAKTLAEKGYSAQAILRFYYKNSRLQKKSLAHFQQEL